MLNATVLELATNANHWSFSILMHELSEEPIEYPAVLPVYPLIILTSHITQASAQVFAPKTLELQGA